MATLRYTTPRTWSATTASARCPSAATCSATLSAAPTATLRSRTPTRLSATTSRARCPSAAKLSARSTRAPKTSFRWTALRTSSALPPGAPTTCAAKTDVTTNWSLMSAWTARGSLKIQGGIPSVNSPQLLYGTGCDDRRGITYRWWSLVLEDSRSSHRLHVMPL